MDNVSALAKPGLRLIEQLQKALAIHLGKQVRHFWIADLLNPLPDQGSTSEL
mgnify:CR=1 FL=1